MTLTNAQALDVVIGCVNKVGGRLIGPTDSLSAGGIVDQARLTSLKTQIVANKTLGVAKFEHKLDPAVLGNMSTGDSAQDAADVVRANADPVAAAAIAAPMGFAGGRPAAATRAAAPRATAPPKSKPKRAARAPRKRKPSKAASAKRGRKPAKRATTRRRKSSRRRQK